MCVNDMCDSRCDMCVIDLCDSSATCVLIVCDTSVLGGCVTVVITRQLLFDRYCSCDAVHVRQAPRLSIGLKCRQS